MNPDTLRKGCADALLAKAADAAALQGFIGLDGFVDDILHVVDKRESAEKFTELQTIEKLAKRIEGAKGRSTNIEIVRDRLKLGGNGPILANALTHLASVSPISARWVSRTSTKCSRSSRNGRTSTRYASPATRTRWSSMTERSCSHARCS